MISSISQPRRVRPRSAAVLLWLCGLTLFLNVAFPKGGLYLGVLPLTWGYLLLGVSFVFLVGYVLVHGVKLNLKAGLAVILLGIFGSVNLSAIAVMGTRVSFADTVSYLVSSSLIPIMTICVMTFYFSQIARRRWVSLLQISLYIVLLFGILSFVSLNVFDQVLGIPFLTYTGGDPSDILKKNINRGSVYKMIATYNNGNILGINTLMWFPLALFVIRQRSLAEVGTRVVYLLTLSRTVWIGWLTFETINRTFVKRSVKSALALAALLPVAIMLVALITSIYFENPLKFLFDKNLGGRSGQLDFDLSLLPGPFYGVSEIVYASMLKNLGVLAFVLFLLTWLYPILLPTRDKLARVAKAGMMVYMVLLASDGAYYLIPTQFVYWMLAAFVFTRKGSHDRTPD